MGGEGDFSSIIGFGGIMKRIFQQCVFIIFVLLVSVSFLSGQSDNSLYTKVKWGMDRDAVKKATGLELKAVNEKSLMADTNYLGLPTSALYVFKEGQLSGVILNIDLGTEKKAGILAGYFNKVSAEISKTYGEFKNFDLFKDKDIPMKDDSNRAFSVLMSLMKWKRDWTTEETTVVGMMESTKSYEPDITVYFFKSEKSEPQAVSKLNTTITKENYLYTKVKWGMDRDAVKKTIGLEFKPFSDNGIMADTKYLGLPTSAGYIFKDGQLSGLILKIDLGTEKKAEILAGYFNKVSAEISKTYGEFKNFDIFKDKDIPMKDDSNRAFSVLMSLMKWKRDWVTGDTTVIGMMESKESYEPDITVFIFKK